MGIAPAGFEFPGKAEAWAPASQLFLEAEGFARSLRDAARLHWYLVARVAPGSTVENTRADLASAFAAMPDSGLPGEQGIGAALLADVVLGDVRPGLLMLGGAVLLVLLIAGVNVANLQLVRGIARRRELTLRAAIGASRSRILRQLATEALVLVSIGATLAVLVGHASLRVLVALAPPELPRLDQVGIDIRALVFTAGAALFTAILFGLLPAQHTTRVNERALRSRVDGHESGTSAQWLRHGLLVAQIAITALVLYSAGLLLRSLDRMQRLELGFAAQEVALIELEVPPSRYRVEAEEPVQAMRAATALHQRNMMRLAERVATLQGVTNATAVLTHPLAGNAGADAMWYGEGQPLEESNTNPYTNYEGVDAAYFATLDLPIERGRAIAASDRADGPLVVVVNRAFGELYWPGQDPIGERIKLGPMDSRSPWRTVVGLAADARYRELAELRPSVYVPYEQGIAVTPRYIGIRTAGDPRGVASTIRRVISEEEPSASIVGITPLPGLLSAPLARPRFQSALIASFASLGLILCIVGTYGALAFFVRQRTREIGIRVALGADSPTVRRFVLRQGLVIGVLGVLAGIAAAVSAAQVIEPLLFGVGVFDPLVLAGTALALVAAVIAASLLPIRQALRADPLVVMRSE
ncbi:MAG: FtsX-like permease family protein [Longimicrobiales bacterium]